MINRDELAALFNVLFPGHNFRVNCLGGSSFELLSDYMKPSPWGGVEPMAFHTKSLTGPVELGRLIDLWTRRTGETVDVSLARMLPAYPNGLSY